ncbi:hypothetical protein CAEBREN_14613 [Caenorhabditis brenneri]|uniref:Uncharacterized protein n=1 Tax=Caenorhabditis brenneri TaxID=135651 RepID=G0N3G2_CAEBE|nr:hypothetical protein CAEBREN_14613 [Caenorhabditis brenneri]
MTSDYPDPAVYHNQKPTNFHCFIDEKMKSEVELSHIIGVRNADSRLTISGPNENFNFLFFEHSKLDSTTTVSMSTVSPDDVTVSSESTTTEETSTVSMADDGNSTWMITSNDTIPDDGFWPFPFPPKRATTPKPPILNTPLNVIFVKNVTVAWNQDTQHFHFLVPDQAFRHYNLVYDFYVNHTSNDDTTLAFHKGKPETRSWRMSGNYTCHFNVKNSNSVCVAISGQQVTVTIFGKVKDTNPMLVFYFVFSLERTCNISRENQFSLPNYLSFDHFFSYADSEGTDYILIHHRGQWIYRLNYRMYLLDQNMFFKVFHLLTPDNEYLFAGFEHADENGLVTKYTDEYGHYRYYYSLFTEQLIGNIFHTEPQEEYEFPTMLRVLFYCSAVYLSIFLTTQMIPNRRPLIFKDLRHSDREIQRLAPVIETVMGKVHAYLEKAKKNGWKKAE